MQHKARSFSELPDAEWATGLLADIADAPCPFAPVKADRPLALYGAGNLGRLARDFLKAVGHDFAFVIDRDAVRAAREPDWVGGRILPLEQVTETDRHNVRLAVCVVLSPYVPIERALSAAGFVDIVPFFDLAENFRHAHPLSNGWFAPPLSGNDRAKAAEVLLRWDDDISRAHHLQFLAWRCMREEWTFERAPHPKEPRFFIADVAEALGEREVYVDAGAYHGVVIADFLAQTHGRFRQIVAIEPDRSSRALLTKNLPMDSRVTVMDTALSDREGSVTFHEGLGYASQISNTGKLQIIARPLDALGLEPTFIKLHLEGGELAALNGARETLLEHRPIIAATVYHNDDGIWRTPLWLMEALPDYKYLFRAHSWCGTGAVVYGIPEERRV
ncbi:MAG: FkbM family methyltransferase [Pseudolabrys sp.]